MSDVEAVKQDVLTEETQNEFERAVFRVLDVDHKDYQDAFDGFVAICNQADAARSFVRMVEEFPTDEDVEAAAQALSDAICGEDCIYDEGCMVDHRAEARAALEAVKGDDR